jgi:hypothetical protein
MATIILELAAFDAAPVFAAPDSFLAVVPGYND